MKKILALILGILFITSNCFATLATYTTISSDAGVTTAALNSRYSEIKTIINGNIESINIKDGTIESEDISIAANSLKRDGENIGEYVYSGCTIATSATLASTITAGVSYVQNDADGYLHRVATAATNKTFTASKDTYVYLDFAGAFSYSEVALGAAQPATPSNSIILAKVVTDATTVASVTDLRQTTPVNLRIYSNYIQGCVISRDVTTANKVTIGPGEVELSSTARKRINTVPTSIIFSTTGIGGLDTGSQAAETLYYIHAAADPDNAVNFECIASTSSTDAATVTGERLIGWCYSTTTSVLSPDSIGAYKGLGGDAPNISIRQISADIVLDPADTWAAVSGTYFRFYSSGRPVLLQANVVGVTDTQSYGYDFRLVVDGKTVEETESTLAPGVGVSTARASSGSTLWILKTHQGLHTVQMQQRQEEGYSITNTRITITAQEL